MNNIRYSFRSICHNPLQAGVKITGLALALTTLLLTLAYFSFELSYDQHFPTAKRVFRLYSKVSEKHSSEIYGISLRTACTKLPAKVPEIEACVQLYSGWNTQVTAQQQNPVKASLLFADTGFFTVFGIRLISGDPGSVLATVGNVVISDHLAEQLFKTRDCIGKTIESEGEIYTISGIMPALPKNTHFSADLLIPMQTIRADEITSLEFQTYYLLRPNVDPRQAAEKIAKANNALMQNWAQATNARIESGIEPLTRLYLHSVARDYIPVHGSPGLMLIVGMVAFFVSLTATVSYINLFIIQGEKRIREMAARTMFGAGKPGIALLFIVESLLHFLAAIILTILLIYWLMPAFSSILQSKMEPGDILTGRGIALISGVCFLLLAIVSSWPVFILTKINYISGLQGRWSSKGKQGKLSTASAILQFTLTSFFISCIIIILAQIRFLQNVPLGFSKSHVAIVNGYSEAIRGKYDVLKSELENLPFITSVSGGEHFMGGGCSGQTIKNTDEPENGYRPVNEYRMKPGFGELMQFELLDGRYLRESRADSAGLILNVAAMKLLGKPPKAGQFVDYNGERMEIIGVVKDFCYGSDPGQTIAPLVIANCRRSPENFYIRSQNALTDYQKEQIANLFKHYDENYRLNLVSLTDVYDHKLKKEKRLASMVSFGAVQVIVISIISLFAMTIMKVSRRTREIGLRKVMGSSIPQVVWFLLKDTVKIVFTAIAIATPASYLLMSGWLQNYADHIDLSVVHFLLSTLLTITTAVLAILYRTIRAARLNPVDALKQD